MVNVVKINEYTYSHEREGWGYSVKVTCILSPWQCRMMRKHIHTQVCMYTHALPLTWWMMDKEPSSLLSHTATTVTTFSIALYTGTRTWHMQEGRVHLLILPFFMHVNYIKAITFSLSRKHLSHACIHTHRVQGYLRNIRSGVTIFNWCAGGALISGTRSTLRIGCPFVVASTLNLPSLKERMVFTHVSDVEYTNDPSIHEVTRFSCSGWERERLL